MKKFWWITVAGLLGMASGWASAAVSLVASVPPYGWTVLPGSQRQFYVSETGGTLHTMTWSVVSGDVTLASTNLPTVLATFGPSTGTCSITGAVGAPPHTVTSTTTAVIRATSVDDPTKHADFPVNVCAKTTNVQIIPAYQQAFPSQKVGLQSILWGNTDETGTWTITSQPGGGNGAFVPSSVVAGCETGGSFKCLDVVFAATVAGRYTIKYTSHDDATKNATSIVYVTTGSGAGSATPAYAVTPNDKTQPVACAVDPGMTGTAYAVGPTHANHTLNSVFNGSVPDGSTIRVFNEDTTGLAPTEYHEYIQNKTVGTAGQGVYLCGVPDSFGNLPIIDGNNSTGAVGEHLYGGAVGAGIVNGFGGGWGAGTPYGYYQTGPAGPNYYTIAGLHVRNAQPGVPFFYPGAPLITAISRLANEVTATINVADVSVVYPCGGQVNVTGITGGATSFNGSFLLDTCAGSTISWAQTGPNESGTTSGASQGKGQYGVGSGCLMNRTGSYISMIGNHAESCTNGIVTYANGNNNAWAVVTQDILIRGNHVEKSGVFGDALEHQMYLQSYWQVIEGNLLDNYLSGAQGADLKLRGLHNIVRYNYLGDGTSTTIDMPEDQDASSWQDFLSYFDLSGWFDLGDLLGADRLTGLQESFLSDIVYGNIGNNPTAGFQRHYGMDHQSCVPPAVFPATCVVNARQGVFYDYNNTQAQAIIVNENGSNGGGIQNGYTTLLAGRYYAANNSFYTTDTRGMEFGRYPSLIGEFHTNMMATGSFGSLASPIVGGNYNGGTGQGWGGTCDGTCSWQLSTPIENHSTGIGTPNFLSTATIPYNATTFVPITGYVANLPVRLQWDVNANATIPRLNPLTIGAVDTGSPPTLTSMALTPSSPGMVIGGSPLTLTCTATYSDASTGACVSPTVANGTPAVASNTGLTFTALTAGTTSVTASIGAVNSPPDVITVSLPPPPLTITGNIKITGSVRF